MMAYRSDRDEDNPPNVEGVEARKAEWDLISGNHQGQRSMTARTGRTQDCTRPARRTVTNPLQRGSHPHRTFDMAWFDKRMQRGRMETRPRAWAVSLAWESRVHVSPRAVQDLAQARR